MRLRAVNLTFHGIGDPARPLETDEQNVWVPRKTFLSVLDAVAGRGDVAITFDDGNTSDVADALPALRDRGLHATFFVVAGRLGSPGFLDEAGVRALVDAGMGIGCHGMYHRPWRRLDDGALREELVEARRILEQVVERPVTQAGCPFGAYDRRTLRMLHRCGYREVYTSDRGTARRGSWIQPRNTVHQEDGSDLIDRVLSSERPAYKALALRTRHVVKRWR